MTQIVYSRTRTAEHAEGRTFVNPRFFDGAVKGATKVFLEPGHDNIVAAYEAANVPVQVIGEEPKPRDARSVPAKKKAAPKRAKAAPAAPAATTAPTE